MREELHVCGVWYFIYRVQSLTLCTMVIRPFPFVRTWKLCVDVANIGSETYHCTVCEKKYAQSQIFKQKSSTTGSVGCHLSSLGLPPTRSTLSQRWAPAPTLPVFQWSTPSNVPLNPENICQPVISVEDFIHTCTLISVSGMACLPRPGRSKVTQ